MSPSTLFRQLERFLHSRRYCIISDLSLSGLAPPHHLPPPAPSTKRTLKCLALIKTSPVSDFITLCVFSHLKWSINVNSMWKEILFKTRSWKIKSSLHFDLTSVLIQLSTTLHDFWLWVNKFCLGFKNFVCLLPSEFCS